MKYKHILTLFAGICVLMLSSLSFAEDNKRAIFYKSYDYEQRENYTLAIQVLNELYQASPLDYFLNYRIGWLQYLAGHYSNSIYHYRQAISSYPNASEPRLGLMLPLLAQQKYAEVITTANQVIRNDPYNYYANLRLIQALIGQKSFELALDITNKMRSQYPSDTLFLQHAAQSQQTLGYLAQAGITFQQLLLLAPENSASKQFFSTTGKHQ